MTVAATPLQPGHSVQRKAQANKRRAALQGAGSVREVEQRERLLFRPKEAARLLAISERSLWGSDIPKVRIGRAVRYDIEDLKAFIARRKESDGPAKS